MRRATLFATMLFLPGCTGLGAFLDRSVTLPGGNPNGPMADSVNLRRALGRSAEIAELEPQPGNIWPGPQKSDPTLIDLQRDQGNEATRGFARTTIPGTAVPGTTDHQQPRPIGSGSPPPGLERPAPGSFRGPGVPPPPASSVPGPGPLGTVVSTPQGPAIDAGGTRAYRQLLTPHGPGAIMVPNGNGTSTVLEPGGGLQTIPTPR